MRVSNKLKEKIIKFFDNLFHDSRTNNDNKYMEKSTEFDDWLINNNYIKNISNDNSLINLVPTQKLLFLNFNNCENLINDFIIQFSNYENMTTFSILKKRFEFYYDKLRDNFGKILQEENQIFICPYCQRNYIGIFNNKDATKGYTAPDLDHFYLKSKYPFLAVTISNLIPSCLVCNQRIKGTKDTYEKSIPNPLEENIFEKIEFDFNYIEFNNDKLPYINSIYISNMKDLDDNYKEYIKFFKIQEQYSLHSEIPKNIKRKFDKYNIVKKNHLKKCCSSLNDKIIEDMVFQEYKYIDKKTTPLWKLKQDIYKKMKNETT